MDSTRYLKIGQVVRSKNGRDIGKVFIVKKIIDSNFVELVDGKRRTILKPKKKKIKHLEIFKKVFEEINLIEENHDINDSYIRKILKPYSEIEIENQEVTLDE